MANDLGPTVRAEGNLPRVFEPSPAYASYSGRPGGFDGSRFAQFIKQNYKIFLLVLVAILLAAAVITALIPKKYSTNSGVLLDQRRQQVVQGLDDVVSNLPGQDSSVVDTEVQLLSSPGMAYQVGQTVGLIPDVDPAQLSDDQRDQVSAPVRNILKHRSIERVGLTYIINIFYTSPNPVQAQQMADAFAQTYVASQINVRVQANERARQHLTQEINRLQTEVTLADAAVARYKAENNLSETMLGGTLTDQEITSYNQALAVARAQEAEDAQRLAAARAQLGRGGADAVGEAGNSPTMALRGQEAALSAKVADLASRYGPNHPELVTARDQLRDLQRLIAAQTTRSIAGLQAEAEASSGRSMAIASKLSQTEAELQRGGAASVKLHDLQAKLDAPRKLLEAYQTRLAQIGTQSGSEQADARIISAAPYPLFPSSPSWLVNMILGLGAGLLFATIAVIARQIFSLGVRSPEDVESSIGVDFLAAIPRVRTDDDSILIGKAVEEPHSPFAEALRSLAASLFIGGPDNPRIVALTSAYAGEGKTTISISLGRSLAMRGRRVLVVDADMQRPSFHQRFGFGSGDGLVELLQDKVPFEKAIVQDHLTPAQFLPHGHDLAPGRTLDETAMASFLDYVGKRYDIVLIDLPPVLQVAETRMIAALADSVVLLARWRHTSRSAIEMALATLARSRATVAGIALTQVPESSDVMFGSYRPVVKSLAAPA